MLKGCCSAMGILMLSGMLLLARPAGAQAPGCVDVLVDCEVNSAVLQTVCGLTATPIQPGIASFVRFGPGVRSVLLTQCGTGATLLITGNTNLCDISGWNDELCEVHILSVGAGAPALNRFGLIVLFLLLSAFGMFTLWRRTQEHSQGR